ncbi:unnamed protein product [Euphydryas editha]|uniref:Histone-lysine N-methyltransferase SETMAR n=1 Tax=Euphydryas editha TaxID=104508 RepID=A0AAU9VAG2_EUPED|nr:unnamed protein product [Euphydryas editha]
MGHPPYSPNLAANDFCLFPHISNKLRGQRFSAREEAVDAFKNHVLEAHQTIALVLVVNFSLNSSLTGTISDFFI